MNAYVLHNIDDLRKEEVARPVPRPGEVLVRVMAAGVCGSDIPRIYRTGAHNMPLIPGHEFSGIVEEVGPDVSEQWVNRRVGVFPLLPCKECPQCKKGNYELCQSYNFLGSRRDGAFAEYAAVPEWNLLQLPEGVSFEEGAMLEPLAVAAHAKKAAGEICPEERIVVCGAGTIGLLLTMVLTEAGLTNVFVIVNKALQKKLAMDIGIPEEHILDGRGEDAGPAIVAMGGADVFFECVGKNETVRLGVDTAAAEGRLILVGNPASDMMLSRECYWKLLRKQMTVRGCWNSSYAGGRNDDWGYALDRLSSHRLSPSMLITHRLSFGELESGLHIMRDKKEEYCKVMCIMPA